MGKLRIAGCQLNTVVGDLEGNADRVLGALARAEHAGCDLALFPELTLPGYPPEDLVLKAGFVEANRLALEKLASRTGRCAAVVGFVDEDRDLYNALAVCAEGQVRAVVRKRELPNYSVFDEHRYFAPGPEGHQLIEIAGVRVGLVICEDAWNPAGPMVALAAGGAEVILVANGSPYHAGKSAVRETMIATRAADMSCAVVYVNLVGGQDELVFDGGSFVCDAFGDLVTRAPQFVEHVLVTDVDVPAAYRKRLLDPRNRPAGPDLPLTVISDQPREAGPLVVPDPVALYSHHEEVWNALVVATHDYVTKNGFSDVVIALSGGIDSSIVAAIAVDALGAERVHGVLMPSRHSSDHSVADAVKLVTNLGIDGRTIEIEAGHAAFEQMLAPSFAGLEPGLAEENIQSRVRGVLLMALSNKNGWLALTTSNKSESAVGYATLYGDTAGGFAVIKDVPKLLVYELSRWRNRHEGRTLIPDAILTKAPSAELRPDQRDDQTLPPYEILDPLLEAYVEGDGTVAALEAQGFDPEIVRRVVRLVDLSEYKRRQTAPGARITPKAFGKDRRLPITNRFRG